MELKLKINDVSYHRNGICGVGFTVVLFEDEDNPGPMVAAIFDNSEGHCCAFNIDMLKDGNIAFAQGNSWRGDRYEAGLMPLIEEWKKEHGTNQIGPFAMPDPR